MININKKVLEPKTSLTAFFWTILNVIIDTTKKESLNSYEVINLHAQQQVCYFKYFYEYLKVKRSCY